MAKVLLMLTVFSSGVLNVLFKINATLLLLLLLLLHVITFMQDIYNYIYPKRKMFLGYTVVQLFSTYSLWYI